MVLVKPVLMSLFSSLMLKTRLVDSGVLVKVSEEIAVPSSLVMPYFLKTLAPTSRAMALAPLSLDCKALSSFIDLSTLYGTKS
jgi:hypothetical protein